MKKPTVDPTFTFGVSLIVSLIISFPSLRLAMRGDLDITDAGIRYFLALAFSWAGVHLVCAIVAMYASQPRRPVPPPATAADQPRRRREDEPASDDSRTTAAYNLSRASARRVSRRAARRCPSGIGAEITRRRRVLCERPSGDGASIGGAQYA